MHTFYPLSLPFICAHKKGSLATYQRKEEKELHRAAWGVPGPKYQIWPC